MIYATFTLSFGDEGISDYNYPVLNGVSQEVLSNGRSQHVQCIKCGGKGGGRPIILRMWEFYRP